MSRHPDVMAMAAAERTEIADLLAGLTPEQWAGPTLCTGWTVRDVVAHMFSYDELSTRQLGGLFVRGHLRLDRINDAAKAAYDDRSPDDLVALVRRHLRPRGLLAGFGGRIALTDATIHHQDIRRPLGLPRTISADRLRVALDFGKSAPTIGARHRIRGLRLVADDLDWSTGRGPEVRGPGEALLMALAGRRGVADELTGVGAPELARRVG